MGRRNWEKKCKARGSKLGSGIFRNHRGNYIILGGLPLIWQAVLHWSKHGACVVKYWKSTGPLQSWEITYAVRRCPCRSLTHRSQRCITASSVRSEQPLWLPARQWRCILLPAWIGALSADASLQPSLFRFPPTSEAVSLWFFFAFDNAALRQGRAGGGRFDLAASRRSGTSVRAAKESAGTDRWGLERSPCAPMRASYAAGKRRDTEEGEEEEEEAKNSSFWRARGSQVEDRVETRRVLVSVSPRVDLFLKVHQTRGTKGRCGLGNTWKLDRSSSRIVCLGSSD